MKGGVGKTTSAVTIAHLASTANYRVLLCDFDPQGCASWILRVRSRDSFDAKSLLKGGKHLVKNIRKTDYPNLSVLPSDFSYRHLDLNLDKESHRKRKLSRILAPIVEEYDLVVIDAPPNVTLESENIVRAADFVFMPLIPSPISDESFSVFIKRVGAKKSDAGKVYTFFTFVDKRRKLHREMLEDRSVERAYHFSTSIPYASSIERMGVRREPLTAYDKSSHAARAYIDLWEEMKYVLYGRG